MSILIHSRSRKPVNWKMSWFNSATNTLIGSREEQNSRDCRCFKKKYGKPKRKKLRYVDSPKMNLKSFSLFSICTWIYTFSCYHENWGKGPTCLFFSQEGGVIFAEFDIPSWAARAHVSKQPSLFPLTPHIDKYLLVKFGRYWKGQRSQISERLDSLMVLKIPHTVSECNGSLQ